MAIYGNFDTLTLLEYHISNETRALETLIGSFNISESTDDILNESVSKNVGIIRTIFRKIKEFFKWLKEKIKVIIAKIKRFINKIFNDEKFTPINTTYIFKGEEKKAIVDYFVVNFIREKAKGCKNKYVLWLIDRLIEEVPKITQKVYDFLKAKIENL